MAGITQSAEYQVIRHMLCQAVAEHLPGMQGGVAKKFSATALIPTVAFATHAGHHAQCTQGRRDHAAV